MKTILKTNLTLIFSIFFLFIAFVNVDAQEYGQWEVLNEGGSFEEIDFVNENVGWIFGNGTLFKTENGGETWNSIMGEDALHFDKIDFVNESVGWAIVWVDGDVEIPSIHKTENGGQSWFIQKEFNDINHPWGQTVTLYAVNNSVVYASICYRNKLTDKYELRIVKTVDGGLTWIDIAPYNSGRTFQSIWFQDANRGIFLGGSPTPDYPYLPTESMILRTYDGGKTWDEKIIQEFTKMYDLQIINDSTAYFLATKGGREGEAEYFLCTTTDTLNSWSIVYQYPYNRERSIISFYCLEDRTIFVITTDDSLMKSIDGGLSWEKNNIFGMAGQSISGQMMLDL